MITVGCPKSTTLASAVTTLYPCPQEFGQVQKFIFWRRGNKMTVASLIIATTWTTLLTATGSTKALVSPFVVGKVTPGAPREAGGGNEGKDGIPDVVGLNPSIFEGHFIQQGQSVIKALKKLQNEALDVLFVNENGQIGYLSTIYGGVATGGYGIPIKGLSINDLEFGDYESKDVNMVKFYLPSNWSNDFTATAATSFALTIVNS